MTAQAQPGCVVDLTVERVRRRGMGWEALQAELVEVPALGPPRPVLVRPVVPVCEQLRLFEGGPV